MSLQFIDSGVGLRTHWLESHFCWEASLEPCGSRHRGTRSEVLVRKTKVFRKEGGVSPRWLKRRLRLGRNFVSGKSC